MITEKLNYEQLKTKASNLKIEIEDQRYKIEYKKKLMSKSPERYSIYNSQITECINKLHEAEQKLTEVELELNSQEKQITLNVL